MTAIQLYKFINENCEASWNDDELIVWIYLFHIEEFCNLVGDFHFEDGGIEVRLQKNCIALDIVPICEANDIDPEEIISKPKT